MGEKFHRPQCTEPCEFQSDWTCWKEGSITIEEMKCISFKPRPSEVEKPEGCPAFDDYGNPILITMTGGKKL